jgi:hypothetical protein
MPRPSLPYLEFGARSEPRIIECNYDASIGVEVGAREPAAFLCRLTLTTAAPGCDLCLGKDFDFRLTGIWLTAKSMSHISRWSQRPLGDTFETTRCNNRQLTKFAFTESSPAVLVGRVTN